MKPSAALVLALLADSPRGLTQMDVLALGGGDSLAQRVHELIAEGHDIRGEYEATPRGARVKRYRYCPPAWTPMRGVQPQLFSLDPRVPGGDASPSAPARHTGA